MIAKRESKMPWTANDAERHTHKAITSELKELWANVANQSLERTGNEGRAVRAANAAVARKAQSAAHGYRLSLTMTRQRVPTGAADLCPVRLETARNAQHVIGIPLQFSLAKSFDVMTAGRAFLFSSLPECATSSRYECPKDHWNHYSLPNHHLGTPRRNGSLERL